MLYNIIEISIGYFQYQEDNSFLNIQAIIRKKGFKKKI